MQVASRRLIILAFSLHSTKQIKPTASNTINEFTTSGFAYVVDTVH